MKCLHPLDAGLMEVGARLSGLHFPPAGWRIIQEWGLGYALDNYSGLRVLIDCCQKRDDRWWVHISVSRKDRIPSYSDMASVKRDFLGERYAYSVWAPSEFHVNIHAHCLHLWALCDDSNGMALPEFSEVLPNIGRSI